MTDYRALYMASGHRDKLGESDWEANDPARFQNLKAPQRTVLLDWIRARLVAAKTVLHRTSYGLKHEFEETLDGFYVTNGAFKGAMLAAGFNPVDASELNWRFRVKSAPKWQPSNRIDGFRTEVGDSVCDAAKVLAHMGQDRRASISVILVQQIRPQPASGLRLRFIGNAGFIHVDIYTFKMMIDWKLSDSRGRMSWNVPKKLAYLLEEYF